MGITFESDSQQEVAKEQELQRVYERIWLPPPVKHEPWD
jgi:hypothetical protein